MLDDRNAKLTQEIFRKTKEIEIPAPPFMKTRIMASVMSSKKRKRALVFWRSLAVVSFSMLFVVTSLFLYRGEDAYDAYSAFVNRPVAIKVEMQVLEENAIVAAVIDLPEGVTFYSKKHPSIDGKRYLKLAFKDGFKKPHLPFVVKSDDSGTREISVRFYDKNNELVAEKRLRIDFKKEV